MTNLLDGLQRVQEAIEYAQVIVDDSYPHGKKLREALALLPSLIEQVKGVEKELREAALTELVRESEQLGLYDEPQPPKEG